MFAAISRGALVYALGAVLSAASIGCGSSDDDTGDPKPQLPDLVSARAGMEPIHAPAGGEDTYCIHRRLDNDVAGYVRKVRGKLTDATGAGRASEPCWRRS